MRRLVLTFVGLMLLAASQAAAEVPVIVVEDPDGAAGRVAAPVSVDIDLAMLLEGAVKTERLRLREVGGEDLAVQFVAGSKGSSKGRLWWLMPEGDKEQRKFQLVLGEKPDGPVVAAKLDRKRQAVEVAEGDMPVLRYNHGTVPPPAEIVEHFEKKQKPPFFYARGDYIHPVYGPDGEELTDDYSMNHPHHRGICWAWPVVRWRGESRDIWAVRVLATEPGGVWARPVSIDRVESGPVVALIEAQSVWKWGDRDSIVREDVAIRAFGKRDRCRFVDVEVRLVALVDELSLGGRPHAGYGGFTFRTFPEFDQRKIDMHIDPAASSTRRAWFHLTGNFPGGRGAAGVALLEHVTNPDYPSCPDPQNADRIAGKYPKWRTVQPAWPGDREVALAKGEPLVLKHRLWIHSGLSNEKALSDVWTTYADRVVTSIECK